MEYLSNCKFFSWLEFSVGYNALFFSAKENILKWVHFFLLNFELEKKMVLKNETILVCGKKSVSTSMHTHAQVFLLCQPLLFELSLSKLRKERLGSIFEKKLLLS